MRKISCHQLVLGPFCVAALLAAPGLAFGAPPAPEGGPAGQRPPVLHPSLDKHHAEPAKKKHEAAVKGGHTRKESVALAGKAGEGTQSHPNVPTVPSPKDTVKGEAQAQSKAAKNTQAGIAATTAPISEKRTPPPPEVQQFCQSTVNAARDARVAWQASQLKMLTKKLQLRIAQLEKKRAEYEDWLHRHNEALKEAKKDVVAIYSRMRPDSAAAQFAAMDEVMAASLLAKLNARVASAILAEMDPGRAARIANAMVGPPIADGGKKS